MQTEFEGTSGIFSDAVSSDFAGFCKILWAYSSLSVFIRECEKIETKQITGTQMTKKIIPFYLKRAKQGEITDGNS